MYELILYYIKFSGIAWKTCDEMEDKIERIWKFRDSRHQESPLPMRESVLTDICTLQGTANIDSYEKKGSGCIQKPPIKYQPPVIHEWPQSVW